MKDGKGRFQTILKLAGLLLCVYTALFFSVIIPFHHHTNGSSHTNDCAICVVANQPFIFNICSYINILSVFFIAVILGSLVVPFLHKENLHLRSPPVF